MTTHVVVPCFNEADRWKPEYWQRLISLPRTRWIFVDDGSSDNTLVLLESACTDARGQVLAQPSNRGKAEAVRVGLLAALGRAGGEDAVAFMDADGAFGIDDVERLSDLMAVLGDAYDALWSSRVALAGRSIERTARRHYLGRIAATILSWNDQSIPYDTQSGFKLFRPTNVLDQILQKPFETRWLFEVEMLNRFRRYTGRPMNIWEEPLSSWQDVPGSKVSGREVLRIGREILKVKRTSHSTGSNEVLGVD